MTTDTPWQGDACSLVDAFRSGDRSPVEELEASLGAIDRSGLNAFSHLDPDRARAVAASADVSLPFGGVPIGIKELDQVAGWPDTAASVVLSDRVARYDSTTVSRVRGAGGVLVGLTTASEFGGVNVSRTKLNGVTHNPWERGRTAGGSSGGSAAAVAGGLVTIASGGDGGGSIRIPAAFCGMPGLKATYGRYPKGPGMVVGSMTAVLGCLSRSVRDITRWLDVANGFDPRDPYSLPRVEGWEAGLGTHLQDLRGRRVAIAPTLGAGVVHSDVARLVVEAAEALAADVGLEIVDTPVKLPELSTDWALSGLTTVRPELGDRYPERADELTFEIAFGLKLAEQMYSFEGRGHIEETRTATNEAMADLFEDVDFVIAATNPDVAFTADGAMPIEVEGVEAGLGNNGALTVPSNIHGNPAMSVPVGTSRGMPVGMQVLGRHHEEALLLDLALVAERERPWPLVVPGAPH